MGGGEQVWEARKLAAVWELDSTDLGATGTGMGMGDEASERLILPAVGVLISYAQNSFAAFDEFIETLTETGLSQPTQPPDAPTRTVQNVLLTHLAHHSSDRCLSVTNSFTE
jgi:hypothetical protein